MSKLTLEIPRFDDLFAAARRVYWAWAEAEPIAKDDDKARLADILSGLPVGRLKVAIADGEIADIAVPAQHAPEKLPPAFLISLTVVVAARWIWEKEDDRWLRGSTAAQAVAARLQLEQPQVCGPELASHFDAIAYFSNGGRWKRRANRMFQ